MTDKQDVIDRIPSTLNDLNFNSKNVDTHDDFNDIHKENNTSGNSQDICEIEPHNFNMTKACPGFGDKLNLCDRF